MDIIKKECYIAEGEFFTEESPLANFPAYVINLGEWENPDKLLHSKISLRFFRGKNDTFIYCLCFNEDIDFETIIEVSPEHHKKFQERLDNENRWILLIQASKNLCLIIDRTTNLVSDEYVISFCSENWN